MKQSPIVVGLGEILWDLLPSGRQLGGAPANFAYCAHLLGNRATVASRVGSDDLGTEIRHRLHQSGLADDFVQSDPLNPTGTVNVKIDPAGQPNFEIAYPAAWDFLDWNANLQELAHSADAICFGSLAQRSDLSRQTILKFLDAASKDAVRVFDVNLRQSFYSAEIIEHSIERANVVKLNDHELPVIAKLLGISEHGFVESVLARFNLRLVCLTRGDRGSLLVDSTGTHEHPGFRVRVKDAVGAGDAFTAGLVDELLRGSPLALMNNTANRMGAWVASRTGAMPDAPREGLSAALAKLVEK
jgi:fructokinase